MNLDLLNPFAQSYPENYDSSVDFSALSARFNPHGRYAGQYIAVGRNDGVVAIYDFETKGLVRWFEGHVKAVTAVVFSKYLLTASKDWNVIVWDLSKRALESAQGERKLTVRFDAPVTSADLHPVSSKIMVVTLQGQPQPVLVDLRKGIGGRFELDFVNLDSEDENDDAVTDAARAVASSSSNKRREVANVCKFSPKGDLVYVGTSLGNMLTFDVRSREHLHTEYIGSPVKHFAFDHKGNSMVINCNDRTIRVVRLVPPLPSDRANGVRAPAFDIQHKFQDLVGRTPWNAVTFSRDGEYIIGGAGHADGHHIYLWDRDSGGLLKILEGPKDPLEDMDWHPSRPLIASVSTLGLVHFWTTGTSENWSAYAPGFEELDENREYQEREDEFDIEDESVAKRRKADQQDRFVDILGAWREHSPTSPVKVSPVKAEQVDPEYEAWAWLDPDDDQDELFHPLIELEDYYEPEPEVPPQVLESESQFNNRAGAGSDDGTGAWSDDDHHHGKKATGRKKRRTKK